MSAVKAAFGKGIELVNLDKHTSIPGCFVFQLPDELTPANIADSLSKAVVLDHVLDSQALHAHDLVFVDDARRKLVLIVSSSISNAGMDTSDFAASLGSVLGAFLLLSKPPLCLCQFLFVPGKIFGIAVGLPIRGNHHGLQAKIKPYLLVDNGQGLDIFF